MKQKPSKEKKPASPQAAYFIKQWKKKKPNDTTYALHIRTGIPKATLYNKLYFYKDSFKSGMYDTWLCADIGIDPVSVYTLTESKLDRDKELNYWKERAFKAEADNEKIKEEMKEKFKAIKKISE